MPTVVTGFSAQLKDEPESTLAARVDRRHPLANPPRGAHDMKTLFTKSTLCIPVFLCLLILSSGMAGCRKATIRDVIAKEIKAVNAYETEERAVAKLAIQAYLAEVEQYDDDFKQDYNQDFKMPGVFDFTVAHLWMRLGSIYDSEGNAPEANAAWDKAIGHLEAYMRNTGRNTMPAYIGWDDPSRRRDGLRAFLEKAEEGNRPKWKLGPTRGK